MHNIITKQTSISNLSRFKESFRSDTNASVYFFTGNPKAWENEVTPDDLVDDTPNYIKTWNEILSLKRVRYGDLKEVVKRIDWQKFSAYDQYDDLADLTDKSFYVLNSELNVYKCISNNNGNISTEEPKGKRLEIFDMADGYRWKYLYSISASDKLRFLTTSWMPVNIDPDVSSGALDGAIEHIIINNVGLNYSDSTKIVIEGDGTGANISPKILSYSLSEFQYANVGIGYRYANAYILDSQGSAANIRAIISPINGHGYNPVQELNAHCLMFSVKTDYTEGNGDFYSNIKFRTIGLLDSPKAYNGNIASDSTLIGSYAIQLSNISGTFIADENIVSRSTNANIWSFWQYSRLGRTDIKYIQSERTTSNSIKPKLGEVMVGMISGAVGTVTTVTPPEAKPYSGSLLYVENRAPITRSQDQSELFHLVLEF
jgi:hypothetical protein